MANPVPASVTTHGLRGLQIRRHKRLFDLDRNPIVRGDIGPGNPDNIYIDNGVGMRILDRWNISCHDVQKTACNYRQDTLCIDVSFHGFPFRNNWSNTIHEKNAAIASATSSTLCYHGRDDSVGKVGMTAFIRRNISADEGNAGDDGSVMSFWLVQATEFV